MSVQGVFFKSDHLKVSEFTYWLLGGSQLKKTPCMNIFIKRYNGQNGGHFTRFRHQNIASRIYALLSVIRQQMSAFDPFRGGEVSQSMLFYRFSWMRASLIQRY